MTTPPAGPRGWRNLGEQPVVETPWFRLRQARVELPGGRQLDHYLLRLPALTMTAMLDGESRVLLLWRHRFIPDSRGWELPSGIAAPGADLAATAARQALAESGWEAIAPRPLLTLQQNSGLADSAVHVFVTRRAIHRGPPEADSRPSGSSGFRSPTRRRSFPVARSRTPARPRLCCGCTRACLGSSRDGGSSDLRLGRHADPMAHGGSRRPVAGGLRAALRRRTGGTQRRGDPRRRMGALAGGRTASTAAPRWTTCSSAPGWHRPRRSWPATSRPGSRTR